MQNLIFKKGDSINMVLFKKKSMNNLILKYESIYKGNTHKIKHLFIPSKKSEYLVVVLSGFNGKEVYGENARYNYIRTLNKIKVNKLFILDEVDNVPTYYYGVNSQPSYLEDCTKLIKSITKKYNIISENIILTGSSKGGTGAILIGNSVEAGYIVAGAPQYFPLDYLNGLNISTKNLIINNILEKEEDFLKVQKDIQVRMLNVSNKTKLFFHAGNEDSHYSKHLKDYLEKLSNKKILYALDLKHYKGHDNVVNWFPNFMVNTLNEIIENKYR